MQMIPIVVEGASSRVLEGIQRVKSRVDDPCLDRLRLLIERSVPAGQIGEAEYLDAARTVIAALADRVSDRPCAQLMLDLSRLTSHVRDLLDEFDVTAKLAYLVADRPDDFTCNRTLILDMFYWHHSWTVSQLLEAGKVGECIDYLADKMPLFARAGWHPFHSILSPAADRHPKETLEILRGLKGRAGLSAEASSIIERVMQRKYPPEQG
jgi:hypothetical protein